MEINNKTFPHIVLGPKIEAIFFKVVITLTVFSILLPNLVLSQETKKRPTIGLILKGGGALGFAHVGVLKVLEKNHIPVDVIAGASMGSIVGAAYASGSELAEMEKVLSETDWNALFGEKIQRPNLDYRLKSGRNRELYGDAKLSFKDGKLVAPLGAVEGQNIRPLFQSLFGNPPTPVNFDSLPLPFRAVTADLETGQAYVPAKGDLVSVVRASMSVPGAFSPVEIDGRMLVDGGIADNLPIDVGLALGADILIVVDLQGDLPKRADLQSPLAISGQMISLIFLQNSEISKKLIRSQDVVVTPNVNGYTVTDFAKGSELMAIGEKSAELVVEKLKKLSISDEEYQQYTEKRTKRISAPHKQIDFIRIKNNSTVSDARIREDMQLKEGDIFDVDKIEADIQSIYQNGHFLSVQYSLVSEGEKDGVELDVKRKDWLDQFIRFGFALEDNLDGDDSFRLGAAYRVANVTTKDSYVESQFEIGQTPKFSTELYQPFTEESPYFYSPKISIGQNNLTISDGNTEIAEYLRTEGTASLSAGRTISTLGETSIGFTRGYGDISRQIGDPTLPEFGYDIGDLTWGVDLDTLDRPDFPSTGFRLSTKVLASVETLGANDDFQDISGGFSKPFTFGRNTIVLRNAFVTTFGDRPVERSYTIGGFTNVSGYTQNSLPASNYDTGGVILFRRFSEVENPFFNLAWYGGVGYEATTIYNTNPNLENYSLINSGTIFVGADTPILPLYLGYGMSDTSEKSIYISMGRVGQVAR